MTLFGIALAIWIYVILHADCSTPSWALTLCVGFGGFLLGEWVGRRNALRLKGIGRHRPIPPES